MSADTTLPFIVSCSETSVHIVVRAKPNFNAERKLKIVDIGNNKTALEIAIKEQPIEGKANTAIIKRLSALLDIPKSRISLISGSTSKIKTLKIVSNPDTIIKALDLICE